MSWCLNSFLRSLLFGTKVSTHPPISLDTYLHHLHISPATPYSFTGLLYPIGRLSVLISLTVGPDWLISILIWFLELSFLLVIILSSLFVHIVISCNRILIRKNYIMSCLIFCYCSCLSFSNLVDGLNVNVALAMCWFSQISYYMIKFIFSSLARCHQATQYATYIAVPFFHK